MKAVKQTAETHRKMKRELTKLIAEESQILSNTIEKFLMEAMDKPKEDVLKMYNQCNDNWAHRAKVINREAGHNISSPKAFEYYIKDNGYKNVITKPLPIVVKKQVLRVVKIVEGRGEFMWSLRSSGYKCLFLLARFIYGFKKAYWKIGCLFKGHRKENDKFCIRCKVQFGLPVFQNPPPPPPMRVV